MGKKLGAVILALTIGLSSNSASAQGAGNSNSGSSTRGAVTNGADNKSGDMPKTNLKETVIPKSGGAEKPADQTPKAEPK